jgi:hypothetical protein
LTSVIFCAISLLRKGVRELSSEQARTAEEFFVEFPEIVLPEAGSERFQRLQLKSDEYKKRLGKGLIFIVKHRMGFDPKYCGPEIRDLAEKLVPEYYASEILAELFEKGQIDTESFYQDFVEDAKLDPEQRGYFWNYLKVVAHYVRDGNCPVEDGKTKELPLL